MISLGDVVVLSRHVVDLRSIFVANPAIGCPAFWLLDVVSAVCVAIDVLVSRYILALVMGPLALLPRPVRPPLLFHAVVGRSHVTLAPKFKRA